MNYIEFKNESYQVAGSRVSLDSIVYGFWNGETPEAIAQNFPVLTLEQVYGAIAFYLANRNEIDEYMRQGERDHDEMRAAARAADPMFYQRMADARRQRETRAA